MGLSLDQADARRLALAVTLGQAAVTFAVALAAWGLSGWRAAESALLGGGISVTASLVMALLGFRRRSDADAYKALRAFFAGEAAKIATVIVLFTMVLRTLKVSPLAMFAGYLSTFIVHWLALANALPTPGAPRARQVI
jgi:ATP synthase protein I